MGYQVQSILSISPGDIHAFFVYYAPGRTSSSWWINHWVRDNFGKIAAETGPTGVVIAPPDDRLADPYIASLIETCFKGDRDRHALLRQLGVQRLVKYERPNSSEERLKFPSFTISCLIVSRTPLHVADAESEVIAVNLHQCLNEQELAATFELVLDAINSDDLTLLKKLHGAGDSKNFPDNEKIIEFKPSLGPVEVNGRLALRKFGSVIRELIEPSSK